MLDRTTPPPVYMMGDLTLPVPNILSLDNGIKMRTFSGGSQDVNQLTLIFKGGCSEAKNAAVARIMSKVMLEGTDTMSGADISEALDFNGAMLKVACDSHITSLNVTSLNSKMIDVLPIVQSVICNPTFPDAVFDLYRDMDAKEHMMAQSKVMTLASQLLNKMIKGEEHLHSHVMSVEEIEHVSVEDVRDFYSQVVTADECVTFLSGNLTPEVELEVKSMLSKLPMRHKAMRQIIMPYHAMAPDIRYIAKDDAIQSAVCIGLPAPARSHTDYVPLRFAVMALGGYFGSRLMKNIREDKGYTYGIGAYLLGAQEGSYIFITAQADKKYVAALIDEVRSELAGMAVNPLSDDELLRLKQYMSSSLMETLDSPFSIMDYYKTIECVAMPKGYFNSQVEWTHKIDQAAIMEMARRYLCPEQMRIAVCS